MDMELSGSTVVYSTVLLKSDDVMTQPVKMRKFNSTVKKFFYSLPCPLLCRVQRSDSL